MTDSQPPKLLEGRNILFQYKPICKLRVSIRMDLAAGISTFFANFRFLRFNASMQIVYD